MHEENVARGCAGPDAGRQCWACGAGVPRENDYCGKCGQGQGRYVHWYYRHSGAALLSLAAGPFALLSCSATERPNSADSSGVVRIKVTVGLCR